MNSNMDNTMKVTLKMSPLIAVLLFSGCSLFNTEHPGEENKNLNSYVTQCPEKRAEMCTMQYDPVCGFLMDKSKKTYSNSCTACADNKVTSFEKKECQ